MKNVKLLILSLICLLVLTACGGQSAEPVGKADTDTAPNEADGGMLAFEDVPQPQMTGDDDFYSETIDAPYMAEYQTMYRVEDDRAAGELETYIAALEAAGFTFDVSQFEKTDEDYVYTARATKNNASVDIDFEWHASDLKSEGDLVIRNGSFHVFINVDNTQRTPSEDVAQFPSLPAAEWEYKEWEYPYGNTSGAVCYTLTKDDLTDYVQTLKDVGFTSELTELPDGDENYLYSFKATSTDGSLEIRLMLSETQNPEVQLTEVFMTTYN